MSELTELESWKADAIRLLGEKVKAEKERDRLLDVAKMALAEINRRFTYGDDRTVENKLADVIAEIERG